MNAAEIMRWIVESPIWDEPGQGVKQYFRREEPGNLAKKPGTVPKGAISTDLRWGQSLADRGQPDIYQNHRQVPTSSGKKTLAIYHVYRRKTGETNGPSKKLLTTVKSMAYPGAEQMLGHASNYLEKVIARLKLKASLVLPAPSSKPLSGRFGAEVAKLLGAQVYDAFVKTAEAKALAPAERVGKQLVALKPGADEAVFDQDIVIVDDMTTSDQTIQQMAQLLWNESAPRSIIALVLIGRA